MNTKTTTLLFVLFFFILGAVKVVSQPTTLNENSIQFENISTALLVGQDGLILKTADSGNTWTQMVSGITNTLNSNIIVTDISGDFSLAAGENGVILKSTDAGTTWIVKTTGTLQNLNDVKAFSSQFILACGDTGTILLSVDLGETWSPVLSGTTENLNDITFVEPGMLVTDNQAIITGENGTILISSNLQDFTSVLSGTTANLNSVANFGDLVLAVGSNGTVLKSVNKGQSWATVTTIDTNDLFDIKFITATVGFASGEDGKIMKFEDGGDTWISITAPTSNDLYAINFASSDFGISVGEGGTELYTVDGGITWSSKETFNAKKNSVKKEVNLSQNYPNPFNPSTLINYELPFDASVSMKVYDMLGKEIRTLASGYQTSGAYTVSFDASNLSSGIYFYVLKANSGNAEIVKTMRMILTK